MGDRALIQFEDGANVSPVVYLHWNGTEARDWIAETKTLMKGREGDLEFTTARFVGVCHSHIKGNMSLGIWNQTARLVSSDSHGDAGCLVVDVHTWEIEHLG